MSDFELEVATRSFLRDRLDDTKVSDLEALRETPIRFVKALRDMISGYDTDPNDVVKVFEEDQSSSTNIICASRVRFSSVCKHHLLPFHGTITLGYAMPDAFGTIDHQPVKVLGLSKLHRLIEIFSRRLQIQEQLGSQLVDFLASVEGLPARSSFCVIRSKHSCVMCRGVRDFDSEMVTTHVRGLIPEDYPSTLTLLSL